MLFDTIAAISTAKGESGIGIVRISGDRAFEILDKIFVSKSGKKDLGNYKLNYGYIYDEEILVDEVLVSRMKGPRSYTTEDIVEVNCHGGYYTTKKILEVILKNGARLAEIGEFTKRAFMNGRIDLSQAEAVIDIIHGKTERAVSLSLDQLKGSLRDEINKFKEAFLDITAHVNVVLDYPEEGIKTVIIGKPNVGKSTLLNTLLREERAIVTHIPGTTRDIIEEVINIKGIPLVLIDTAGIRDTEDYVENIGVQKSLDLINDSDLVLFVLDSSRELEEEDIKIIKKIKELDKNYIVLMNKIDLNRKLDISQYGLNNIIEISAQENIGIENMEDNIYEYIVEKDVEDSSEKLILTNIRHKTALEKTKQSISNIFETIDLGLPLDLISVDLKEGLDSLSEITGEISSEDVLDHIFAKFCVGK